MLDVSKYYCSIVIGRDFGQIPVDWSLWTDLDRFPQVDDILLSLWRVFGSFCGHLERALRLLKWSASSRREHSRNSYELFKDATADNEAQNFAGCVITEENPFILRGNTFQVEPWACQQVKEKAGQRQKHPWKQATQRRIRLRADRGDSVRLIEAVFEPYVFEPESQDHVHQRDQVMTSWTKGWDQARCYVATVT